MPTDRKDDAPMLRGNLTTFRRRCGKPSCRCATGEPHESPALTYTQGGRTKTLTLSASEVKVVRAALARYSKAKTQLDRSASRGLQALQRSRVAGQKASRS
jgi:hypothetical protein